MTGASRREFLSVCGAAAISAGGETLSAHIQAAREWPSTFPALRQQANGHPLVYLDSAATTLRPQSVIDALVDYYSTDNANPSKVHRLASRAADRLDLARRTVARFIGAADPSEVIFVRGTTEGINLIASSWGGANLRKGDEVVVSVAEHYSNLMPWTRAAEHAGASVRVADVDAEGRLTPQALTSVMSARTRLVAFSHVSNVLGYVNPVGELTAAAKAAGAAVVIDGAQGAPHVPVDVRQIGCDFYVFSGHKMLGPMGTGVVWGKRDQLDAMPPYHVGSNMAHNVSLTGAELEHGALKYQAGTPDVAGPVGLAAAVSFFEQAGRERLQRHDSLLAAYGLDSLRKVERLRLIGPSSADRRVPVFTFSIPSMSAAAVAAALDGRGIAVRAGDMAALPLLKRFGVTEAVRASAYVYSTTEDIDRLTAALQQLIAR
jgi:cysteine desulfurase / selenocysteine lyase